MYRVCHSLKQYARYVLYSNLILSRFYYYGTILCVCVSVCREGHKKTTLIRKAGNEVDSNCDRHTRVSAMLKWMNIGDSQSRLYVE